MKILRGAAGSSLSGGGEVTQLAGGCPTKLKIGVGVHILSESMSKHVVSGVEAKQQPSASPCAPACPAWLAYWSWRPSEVTARLGVVRARLAAPSVGSPPTEVRNKLRTFTCSEPVCNASYPLEDDEPMMTGGLIGSFCVAYLGVFIEMEFQVYIPDVDLTVENMDTLRLIAQVSQER